jgi:hypothetical protein
MSMRACWEFPARTVRGLRHGPLTLHWSDGGLYPPELESGALPKWGMGVLFVGERGSLLADYGRHQLFPEERYEESFRGFVAPAPWIPDSVGHHREWIQACKTRGPTSCAFEYSGPLTETVLLGNVAYRAGKPFDWDARSLRASESAAARHLG